MCCLFVLRKRDSVQRLRGASAPGPGQRDEGDSGRRAGGGGVPADGGRTGVGGHLLQHLQQGRPHSPKDLRLGPRRTVLALTGITVTTTACFS